jgi:hypothetical protein
MARNGDSSDSSVYSSRSGGSISKASSTSSSSSRNNKSSSSSSIRSNISKQKWTRKQTKKKAVMPDIELTPYEKLREANILERK